MTEEDRPPIPQGIKRTVRQECFFGCVLCGAPVFHYDHIEEYSVVKEHTTDNLALLCERHHGAKTTGKLSKERVKEGRLAPFNRDRVVSAGWQQEGSRLINIELGGNSSACTLSQANPVHHVLWNTGSTFLALHWTDGWYSISAVLTDENGQPLLVIDRGELKVFSQQVWDYQYEGTTLKVRGGFGVILLNIRWSDTEFVVERGCFMNPQGDGFTVGNGLMTVIQRRVVGMSVGSSCAENSFGSWGLNNSAFYPTDQCPGGFGFFQGV